MEVWIPKTANISKLETNLNIWLDKTTEYPYLHKIQDRINSYFPTLGQSKILYIIKLENNKFVIPHVNIPKKTCSICLETDCEDFEELFCGHQFHLRCINKWFKNKNNCPLCRTQISI